MHILHILVLLHVTGLVSGLPAGDDTNFGLRQLVDRQDPYSNVGPLVSVVQNISLNINRVMPTIKQFRGGSRQGIDNLRRINSGVAAIGTSINQTTRLALRTGQLSQGDSATLSNQLQQVQPQMTDFLRSLAAKRPQFDAAGFGILDVTSLMRVNLRMQMQSAQALGDAMTRVVQRSYQPVARQVSDQIQGDFNVAINAFQGRGGSIRIPPKVVPQLSSLLNAVADSLGVPQTQVVQGDAVINNAVLLADNADGGGGSYTVSIDQDRLRRLGEDENDTNGIPSGVMDVLRKFEVI